MNTTQPGRRAPAARRSVIAALALLAASPAFGASTPTPDRPADATSAGPTRVLVIGGTGQLGAEIVQRLVARGHQVTVFVRPSSDRSRLATWPVDYVTGDLFSEADMAATLKSRRYDAVIVALRVMDGDVNFYSKALTPLARHAREAGVGQIIHHGAVGAGANVAKFQQLGWERVPGLLDRLRDQGIGEDLLRGSGVPYTIIRNSRIYPADHPATGRAELTEDDSVITPMTRADLADLTVQCLGAARCMNRVFHVRDPSLAWPPPKAAP